MDQLYFLILAAGKPQEAQVFFWIWKDTCEGRSEVGFVLKHKHIYLLR